MDTVGKVFQAEQGQRRCKVCEGLFTRDEAAAHAAVPCVPVLVPAHAAAAGQSH